MLSLEEIRHAIVPLAEKYGIDRVFLFGSYARGEATDQSDIDLRIDRGTMGGLHFGGFYEDVLSALQCPADIITTPNVPSDFLKHIQKEEILLYDRKQAVAI